MAKMKKYDPLTGFLRGSSQETVELGFDDIEQLVGSLPVSATKYRQWWENGGRHSQARAWLAAGYQVDDVNQGARRVRFKRA